VTTTRDPPWARLPGTARRFTLGEVRSLCARLPRPRTKAIHEVEGEAGVIVTKRPATMVHHRGERVQREALRGR